MSDQVNFSTEAAMDITERECTEVQQLGGHVWVESELEQGSKFFFTLKEGNNAS